VWFRGLRCVSVLVGVVGVKGAFGVRCADRTSSTLDVMKERGLRSSLVTPALQAGVANDTHDEGGPLCVQRTTGRRWLAWTYIDGAL
jgi:hypothetical protein